jgi:transcriptional regulator with XRE-family HTH domain
MSPLLRTRPALIDFGQQLRRIRTAAQMSQVELARRALMGEKFIRDMEHGRENPSLESMVLLADGLGCEMADFFPRKGRT